MTDFVSNWNNELLTRPLGPLGIIAMPGCEEAAKKINEYLMKWYEQQEALEDMPLYTQMGANRENFLIEAGHGDDAKGAEGAGQKFVVPVAYKVAHSHSPSAAQTKW